MKKLLGIMNCLALVLVAQSVTSACLWMWHQPELPANAKEFLANRKEK